MSQFKREKYLIRKIIHTLIRTYTKIGPNRTNGNQKRSFFKPNINTIKKSSISYKKNSLKSD
jgi:hypothetical protein